MRTSADEPAASSAARSLSGATTKNVAPCSVSGRVEKTVTRLVAALDLEVDVGADRAADPVALHPDDLLRPEALELVQVVEQAVGVVGDLEVPLRELLLHDLGAAALAVAVDDLLVREHGLVVRAPVDRALLAVGQAALVQALEQPLVPAVVLRVARVQDPRPVVRRRRTRGSSSCAARCSRTSTRADRRRAGSPRSRRAGRRSPSRSG